jgi:hypothetical protein
MRRQQFAGLLIIVLAVSGLAWAPSAAADEIGGRIVGGMKIEAEIEDAEAMQMFTAGRWMIHEPAKGATHHFEVILSDPYAGVTATFVNLATKAKFAKRLDAMYGKQLHYGANVSLASGRYRVAVAVGPPALMREGEALNRWLSPVKTLFTFTVA